ncbi:protein LEG1 homolog [Xyrichtys novacula]|uniref:Protein LEG1 homolog n=1 Tax=Xyrichtys novacula TaxID=13765 RepID=A0AAV1GY38_XYRNO|nr:protein LEG1 homolog [Xyrichtys novacula]
MLRQTVLGLLLACAVSFSRCSPFGDGGMLILWAQTASQISEFPAQDGVVTPNPWHFYSRMSLYRLVIGATDKYMGTMGTGNTDSPLWGLPLQLGWMLNSGRLGDPSGASTCGLDTGDTTCISTESWWACENYFVSVLPFLSAAQNGILGDGLQVRMQVPEGVTNYCTTYAECAAAFPDAMAKWDQFFQGLKASVDSPLPDAEKRDAILGLYWEAHMASTYASAACDAKKTHYSAQEVSFSQSWVNSAEFVSAARFQSSLDNASKFITPLPSRILKESDNPPKVPDLSDEENHTLYVFSWMNSINSIMGGTLVQAWKQSMCSADLRAKGRDMMVQLMLNPAFPTSSFVAVVSGMALSC